MPKRSGRRAARPELLELESRRLLAVFQVTSNADSGPGSLRQAILDAEADAQPDTIRFAIGSGLRTIELATPLPTLTRPVTIDGRSQPNDGPRPDSLPRIELAGQNMTPGAGLTIRGPGVVVAGLAINRMPGLGISIAGAGGARVVGCFIGTSPDGDSPRGNRDSGIFINDAPRNSIGGQDPADGNLISGNISNGSAASGNGIRILGSNASANLIRNNVIGLDRSAGRLLGNGGNGIAINSAPGNVIRDNIVSGNNLAGILIVRVGASGNQILGNLVGTNPAGGQFPNNIDGIELIEAPGNVIGGPGPVDRNVVAGNGGPGISVRGPNASGNRILGNHIGVVDDGTRTLGNVGDGILIQNATGTSIGGSLAGQGNLIGGNRTGVNLQTSPPEELEGTDLGRFFTDGEADRNVVLGNQIGTDGQDPLGNLIAGISVVDGSDNTIGGLVAGARNIISSNLGVGIQILSDLSTGNLVVGNAIGTDGAGLRSIPNVSNGILIDSASANTLGGSSPAARNLISGNQGNGIRITDPSATGNRVLGNWIGVDASGVQDLGNFGDGIRLDNGTSGNVIGGAAVGEGNVLSGNGGSGLQLIRFVIRNYVAGNFLGLGADGSTPVSNNISGVQVSSGSQWNTIGGEAGARNVIGSNVTGIGLRGAGTTGNRILGNIIGADASGTLPRGNTAYGILITDRASGNVVGSPGLGNQISANGLGITIIGPDTGATLIQGNRIGTDATGTRALGNLQNGIFFRQSAGNVVGGTVSGAGNLISANRAVGIQIFSDSSSGNLIQGNRIGTDRDGRTNVDDQGRFLGNGLNGILLDNAPGNIVGGLSPSAGNLVSGNKGAGILVTGPAAKDNRIFGNRIGTDPTGAKAIGNSQFGVEVVDAPGTWVGGSLAGAGNLISGNLVMGVSLEGSGSRGVLVAGNRIGTNAAGTAPLANGRTGVVVTDAPLSTIGGPTAAYANLIAGNALNGITVTGARTGTLFVQNNRIGTSADGTSALANRADGVLLDSTSDVLLGGANLISGNILAGVRVQGTATRRIVIVGNRIGTNVAGTAALANENGVVVEGAPGVQIGGTAAAVGNQISGNAEAGVLISGAAARGNLVAGNLIGTDPSGTKAIGNNTGIQIDGAPANTLGANALGGGNLLAGNSLIGIQVAGDGANGNVVIGNRIGTNAAGDATLKLAATPSVGILLNNAKGTLIGNPAVAGSGNLIAGHLVGVVVAGFGASGNVVAGNRIGTDASGTRAIPNTVGVYINGAPSNSIGGSVPAAMNLISGNRSTGITILGALSTGNVVAGNRIGTDASGTRAIPNATGIYLESAPANLIGGATAASGNLISGNTSTAIYLFQVVTAGNLIRNNRIGTDASGGRGPGNGQYGVLLFNAPANTVDRSKSSRNLFFGNGIADVREFSGRVTTSTRSAAGAPLMAAPAGKVRKTRAVPKPSRVARRR